MPNILYYIIANLIETKIFFSSNALSDAVAVVYYISNNIHILIKSNASFSMVWFVRFGLGWIH